MAVRRAAVTTIWEGESQRMMARGWGGGVVTAATHIIGVLLEELGPAAGSRAAGDLAAQLGESVDGCRGIMSVH
jgi:hypothetical protein